MTALPRCDRRMGLEARGDVPDGAGGYLPQWREKARLWLAVTPLALREGAAGGLPATRPRYRFDLRAAPLGDAARPLAGERFTEGPRRFAILAVGESLAGPGWLSALVEEEMLR